MFDAETRISDEKQATKKRLVFGITVGLTLAAIGLVIALYLGTLGYDVRRSLLHEARLKGVLEEEPTLYQVTVGLEEKAPLVASPQNEGELEQWIAKYGDQKREEILEKGREWPITRIFDAGDMIYFIYFDEEQIMRDFTYISTPGYVPE
ncbi:MAG: hypothetical protein ACRD1X_20585 [Vicinamibacteria bacterium]